jgi:excisionase family DNA binding protein
MSAPDLDALYASVPEAAKALGVHPRTAWEYIRRGRLPARKVGAFWRVLRTDLAAFAKRYGREVRR